MQEHRHISSLLEGERTQVPRVGLPLYLLAPVKVFTVFDSKGTVVDYSENLPE